MVVVVVAQRLASVLVCLVFWSFFVSFSLRAGSLVWVPRTGEAGEKNEALHSSRQLSVAAPHPNK